ncbi:MAG: hypothetical protein QXP94_06990 [Thermofilaceae archaeon]
MTRDFRDESEAQMFIGFALRTRGTVYFRKRIPGAGLPDIDILLEAGELIGYEVKYFPVRESLKAHEGVGETLAILLYGLDKAYLVHVFDSGLGSKYQEAVAQTAKLVSLLPIGYLYCIGRAELKTVKDPETNPFLNDPQVKGIREKLLQALSGQPSS